MTIEVRGITYDTGSEVVAGRSSRPRFVEDQVARELEIIARDLHCSGVRITGSDLGRLEVAARHAAGQGLEVWLSPVLHDRPAGEVLDLVGRGGALAAALAREGARVVLVVGLESSAFVPGMIEGTTTFDRLRTLGSLPRLLLSTVRRGSFNRHLDRHLASCVDAARRTFGGPLTYASGLWEQVDWSRFDIVGVDAYRDSANAARYGRLMGRYARVGKPVAALELGCCTYSGAGDKGGFGWSVVDPVARTVREGIVRDEAEQADHLEDVLGELAAAGVGATFPFTFASYSYPTLDGGPDLDVGAYGIVRCLEGRTGVTYPGMPWEPKLAFHRLARIYGAGLAGTAEDAGRTGLVD